MFRFLQCVEWEPSGGRRADSVTDAGYQDASFDSTAATRAPGDIEMRPCPQKYLLLQPSFSTLMSFLAHAFNELTPFGVQLLYISCDRAPTAATSSLNCSTRPDDGQSLESPLEMFSGGGGGSAYKICNISF